MLYLAVILPFIVNFMPIKNKKLKVLIAIAPAIYIILFRFGLGTDYFSYEFIYNQHNVSSLSKALNAHKSLIEPGFRLLIYLFKSLNLPFQFFVASISLTIYLFIVKWIVDSQEKPLLQIMLFNGMFFVVWALSGLRQGLVIAIATYFILNRKKQLSYWQEILLIVVLAQFHISAYVYLLIILAKRISFNKKQLITILAIGLVMTLIPYQLILEPFKEITFVKMYLHYLTNNIGFWDFSGIVRLIFVLFTLLFYDKFKKDKFMLMLANVNILGFALYFLLKASEVTASRVSVFTFILIIPLIVYVIKTIERRQLQIVTIVGAFTFSLVYLEKDLLNTQSELGQKPKNTIYKLKTIFSAKDQDYLNYNNRYTFLSYQGKICPSKKQLKSNVKKSSLTYEALVVKEKEKYGIINSEGDWIAKPSFNNKPEVLKDIIVDKDADKEIYLNFELQEISVDEDLIKKYRKENTEIKEEKPEKISTEYKPYEDILNNYFPYEEDIKSIVILKYKLPYEYAALRVSYQNKFSYFTLDKNLKINNDLLFKRVIRPNINNMDIGYTYCGSVGINGNDDIVWIKDK